MMKSAHMRQLNHRFIGWRCPIRDGKSLLVIANMLDWSGVIKDRDGSIRLRAEGNNIRQR